LCKGIWPLLRLGSNSISNCICKIEITKGLLKKYHPNKRRLLGFVVVQIKIIQTPKATAKPIHGVFIDKAAKNPKVAMIQVTKNQNTVLIVIQIYVLKFLKGIT